MKDLLIFIWNTPLRKPDQNRQPPCSQGEWQGSLRSPPKQRQCLELQTDSDKTREAAVFNQDGTSKTRKMMMVSYPLQDVLRERSEPHREKQVTNTPSLWAASPPFFTPYQEEVQNPKNEPYPLKIRRLRTRSSTLMEAGVFPTTLSDGTQSRHLMYRNWFITTTNVAHQSDSRM